MVISVKKISGKRKYVRQKNDDEERTARIAGTMWKPGKGGPGRPRGLQNKFTRLIKEAVAMAAENAGNFLHSHQRCQSMGLTGYLEWMSLEHPAVFGALIKMIYPSQVTVKLDDGRQPYKSFEDLRQAMLQRGLPPEMVETTMPKLTFRPLDDDDVIEGEVAK